MARPTNNSETFLNQLITQIQLHLQTVGGIYITLGTLMPSPLPIPGFKTWTGYTIPGAGGGLVTPEVEIDEELPPLDNNTFQGILPVALLTSEHIINDSPEQDGKEVSETGELEGHKIDSKLKEIKKEIKKEIEEIKKETNPPSPIGKFVNQVKQYTNQPTTIVSCPTKEQIFLKGGKINYELQLSPNIKLKDVTTNVVFPHQLQVMYSGNDRYVKKAKGGRVEIEEIVCNLKSLAVNIIEPLLKEYPGFLKINSAFRATSTRGGTSQHMVGEAIDIQWKTATTTETYMERANWILQNIPVDQIIYEHTGTYGGVWLHISHRRSGVQRKNNPWTMKEQLQYNKKLKKNVVAQVFTQGFYNHYPSK